MSAPDVNIERQKARHKTMVRGLWIGAVLAIAAALAVYSGLFTATAVMPSAD
jgi:hypothetical protein